MPRWDLKLKTANKQDLLPLSSTQAKALGHLIDDSPLPAPFPKAVQQKVLSRWQG